MNAVGIYATSNGNPLEYLNTPTQSFLFNIVSKSSTNMTLRSGVSSIHSVDNYLGAIVSADRQTIYWVNNTNPLP